MTNEEEINEQDGHHGDLLNDLDSFRVLRTVEAALAWGKYRSYDIPSGARRGPAAMREEADAIFHPSEPKQLRWRGLFHGRHTSVDRSLEMFDVSLRGLLENAPEGATAHAWASFWSHGEGESSPTDVHKAVEEGWNVWRNGLGFQHPKDVERDNYAFATVLTGGEMAFVDAGHANDGLEKLVIDGLRKLANASGGAVVYPGGGYKPGCRRPGVHWLSTKALMQGVRATFPEATDEERDELVRLLYWKGRRAYVVLCVAFLTREEMTAARAQHDSIKERKQAKHAATKKRRAKRAAEDAAAEGSTAKRRRRSLSDVTNVGGDGANTTRGSPG